MAKYGIELNIPPEIEGDKLKVGEFIHRWFDVLGDPQVAKDMSDMAVDDSMENGPLSVFRTE